MFSWGRSDYGQLGLGGIEDGEICCPKTINDIPLNVQDVKSGESHSVLLSEDGKVFTCGSNDFGQVLIFIDK